MTVKGDTKNDIFHFRYILKRKEVLYLITFYLFLHERVELCLMFECVFVQIIAKYVLKKIVFIFNTFLKL